MMDDALRQHATLVRRVWIVSEAGITALAFLTAYALRDSILPLGETPLYPLEAYEPVLLAGVLLWSAVLYARRLYHTQRLATVWDQWLSLGIAGLLVILLLGVGLYLTGAAWVSRGLVVTFVAASYLFLGLERSAVLWLMHATRRRGLNQRHAVMVGSDRAAGRLQESFERNPHWGISLLGRVSFAGEETTAESPQETAPNLGDVADLPRLLDQEVIDEVFVSLPPAQMGRLVEIIALAELRGVTVRLIADLADLQVARTEIGLLDGSPMLTFTTLPKRANELLLKRLVDLGLATALLPVAVPLLVALVGVLWITGTRSPIFRQIRVGRNGRHFTLYKLRTMQELPDLEAERLDELNKLSGPVFKADPDPRVTPVGRFLRRRSLDELPQLFNVLKGEMSLVGPRPPLPDEVRRYRPWQLRRLSMRPGMTGLWQVSGRIEPDFDDWVRLDLQYIDNWSILLDLKILCRTIPSVISGQGAR